MTSSKRGNDADQPQEERFLQFDMQSLLWLTVTVCVALMYLRPVGQREVLEASAVVAAAACAALVVGALSGRLGHVHRRSVLRYDATATMLMTAIVIGNYLSRLVAPVAMWGLVMCCLAGCSDAVPTADSAPFEAAVSQYLAQNDMALRLKRIRRGPSVEGETATMTASMTHRELGGPSVVWTFQFRRGDDSRWMVTSHSDR